MKTNFWNKLTNFVNRFHKNKPFIAFIIIFITAITTLNYEFLVKDILVYPTEQYNELETIATNHFKKIKDGVIEDLPDNIDYNFEITNNNINARYSTETENENITIISLEINQYAPDYEIELTRDHTEENFRNFYRFAWILSGIIGSLFICLIFSVFCYIIRFINWIIDKITSKSNNTPPHLN